MVRTSAAHWAGVLLGTLTFAGLAVAVERRGPILFDAPVLHAVAGGRFELATDLLRLLTQATRFAPLVGATLVIAILLLRVSRRDALFLVLAFLTTAGLNQALKFLWRRVRPEEFGALYRLETYAFPSGHAMTTLGLWLALSLVTLRLRPRMGLAVTYLGGIIVLLVGFSRVYLGVHFPTDVVAGWGAATAWVLGLDAVVTRASPRGAEGTEKR